MKTINASASVFAASIAFSSVPVWAEDEQEVRIQAPSSTSPAAEFRVFRTDQAQTFRVQLPRVQVSQMGYFSPQEHARFTLSTPMPATQAALTVAATMLQMQPSEGLVWCAQAASFLLKRQVRAEWAYSLPTSATGKLDSSIRCQLNLGDPVKPYQVVASVRYRYRF
jgi:hypothetical protein